MFQFNDLDHTEIAEDESVVGMTKELTVTSNDSTCIRNDNVSHGVLALTKK